jgi:hypothetical protein
VIRRPATNGFLAVRVNERQLPSKLRPRSQQTAMSTPEERDGPPLLRPIPRRPFDLTPASLLDDESAPNSPNPNDPLLLTPSRFLERPPRFEQYYDGGGGGGSGSLSRATSALNLTASTLFGIFGPTASGAGKSASAAFYDEPGTPWGTGAQTPAKRGSLDGGYEQVTADAGLQDGRAAPPQPPRGKAAAVASLAMRATLLFALGMGYGALVSRLQGEPGRAGGADSIVGGSGAGIGRLALWGASGIILGTLLPWFDGVWDNAVGTRRESGGNGAAGKDTSADTDWALVMRSIGAFAGIVLAIVSATLPRVLRVPCPAGPGRRGGKPSSRYSGNDPVPTNAWHI